MSAADIRRIALLKKWDAEMAQKSMTNADKERADFEEWRTELLALIFHYANGAMLNGKTELKRHIARIERQIDAVPRAGREAERAEAVTDAEPRRRAFYDQCGTGHPTMTAPGYRLVPIDPVDEMLDAAETVDFANEDERAFACNLWYAYLAAAPQPEPPADIVERAREFWRRLALVTGGLCDDDDEVEAIAAFAQEHAVAEKARADKAEKALADIVDTWTRAHTAPEDATAIRARKGGGDE